MRNRWVGLACALSCVSTAGYAEQRFGDRGTASPVGTVGLSYASTSPASGSSSSVTDLNLSPGFGYFVADGVVLGGSFTFRYLTGSSGGSNANTSTTFFGLTPAVGLNFWLSERISVLPQLALRFGVGSTDSGVSSGSVSLTLFTLGLSAPFLIHVAPHFFIGAGPQLSVDLLSHVSSGSFSGDGPKTTAFGVSTVIGGWF